MLSVEMFSLQCQLTMIEVRADPNLKLLSSHHYHDKPLLATPIFFINIFCCGVSEKEKFIIVLYSTSARFKPATGGFASQDHYCNMTRTLPVDILGKNFKSI